MSRQRASRPRARWPAPCTPKPARTPAAPLRGARRAARSAALRAGPSRFTRVVSRFTRAISRFARARGPQGGALTRERNVAQPLHRRGPALELRGQRLHLRAAGRARLRELRTMATRGARRPLRSLHAGAPPNLLAQHQRPVLRRVRLRRPRSAPRACPAPAPPLPGRSAARGLAGLVKSGQTWNRRGRACSCEVASWAASRSLR